MDAPQPMVESPPPISRYDDSYNESLTGADIPSRLIHIGPRTLKYSVYFGGWLGPPAVVRAPTKDAAQERSNNAAVR